MPQKGSYPIDEVFFALCKHVNTPVSLSAWLKFKYSVQEYLDYALPIGDYLECDTDRFGKDYMVTEYLSKYKEHRVKIDVEAVALQKFDASEDQCRATNGRIKKMRSQVIKPELSARMFRAKRKIAALLGPFSMFCIDPHFGWSPGATFDLKRQRAQVDRKDRKSVV